MPASNKTFVVDNDTTSAQPPKKEKEASGWDPFEIWRTRVLLPRLAQVREEKTAGASVTPVKLVRS
jgi:hypothetical protein